MIERNTTDPSSTHLTDSPLSAMQTEHLRDLLLCVLKDRVLACLTVSLLALTLFGHIAIFFFLFLHIKRNAWTAYIWNLAIANCGVFIVLCSAFLLAFILSFSKESDGVFVKLFLSMAYLFLFTQCSSMHFLLAISIDLGLAAVFPIWHRYRQPKYLSSVVSAILSALLWLFTCQLFFFFDFGLDRQKVIALTSIIFLPLVSISFQTVIINTFFDLGNQGKFYKERILEMAGSIVMLIPLQLFFTLNSYCVMGSITVVCYALFFVFYAKMNQK